MTPSRCLCRLQGQNRRAVNAGPAVAARYFARRRSLPSRAVVLAAALVLLGVAAWTLFTAQGARAPGQATGVVDAGQLWLLAVITCVALFVVVAMRVLDAAATRVDEGAPPLRATLAGAAEASLPTTLAVLTAASALAPPLVAPELLGQAAGVPSLVVSAVGVSFVGASLARPPAGSAPSNRRGARGPWPSREPQAHADMWERN